MRFFEKWTENEWAMLIAWVLKMIRFWAVSGFGYMAIIEQNKTAGWILGSLVVLEVWDWYKEKQKHEDNGRKTAE